MEIAICLSGAPRNIERALESISFIEKTGNVKVFIHSWMNPEDSISIEKNSVSKWEMHQKFSHKDIINKFVYEKIQLDSFDTRLNCIKKYKEDNNICITQFPNSLGPFCMFYSLQQVGKIKSEYEKEYSMKFDMVYRMRFDSYIFNPEVLPIIPYEEETLAIPDQNDHTGINDQFAYGTSKAMEKYFNSYSIFPNLNNKSFRNAENLLKICIQTQNIPIIRTSLRVGIHDQKN